ncbi:Clavaminate synthase-like protein [Aspergillus ellipticus CBS 707.79]|uniref:Clavaminate synthase-like protein n=1 Tax=Aspergillus ellipticus CBS 707.79 TaxID=1448320 RepID=A0A319D9D1_9EURO|nr:Clavaminate synthase-like protein [Aspergillus ellipticus CBS 707.79]
MVRLLRTVQRVARAPLFPSSILYRRAYSTPAAAPPSAPSGDASPASPASPSSPAAPNPEINELDGFRPPDTAPEPVKPLQAIATKASGNKKPRNKKSGNKKFGNKKSDKEIQPLRTIVAEASGDGQPSEVVQFEKHLMFTDQTSKPIKILYSTLRDACKCPRCVDPHSKQRNFRTSDIPANIAAADCRIIENKLIVRWSRDIEGYDDSHVSEYDFDYLRNPTYLQMEMESTAKSRRRAFWNKSHMNKWQHWVSYDDYMNNDEAFSSAMLNLARLGLIFVKNIPDSREMVEKIATRMGPLRNTFYGSTWDVRTVPEAKNVAYTSQFLNFHMDLMYMNEPPGFQLLHCLENSCDGGESLFSDTFRVAYDMFNHHAEAYERLTKFRIPYEYNNDGQRYSKTWPVFKTKTDLKGTKDEWVFNLERVGYSPPFQASMHRRHQVEGYVQHASSALKLFAKKLESPKAVFELKLNPGECVIFENRRVAHARRAFNTNGGQRWLAGAYVDDDALISKFRVLREQRPDIWTRLQLPNKSDVTKKAGVSQETEAAQETEASQETEATQDTEAPEQHVLEK